ncbi:hypothetical protein CC86DRAFT_462657 [Ophiobolus disseminans]|uniref:Uncharacterized protein n=1 Tax=Ophiobolus disseminans TaxID=1469910 RepID=A0A6A7AID0_9PLEO|nr:hypothetical protein CC86DRAFT_462657 [Ophiobolus disseminans]
MPIKLQYGTEVPKSPRSTQPLLTKENLRMHSAFNLKSFNNAELQPFEKQTGASTSEGYHAYSDDTESDDGEVNSTRNIEMRRAASLGALQAYGGCFVSGFLAMQEPLPVSRPTTTRSSSATSVESLHARPDSATLGQADIQELSGRRQSSWIGARMLRKAVRKSRS